MSKNRAPMTPAVAFDTADLLTKRTEAAQEAAKKLQEATREANATLKAVVDQREVVELQTAALLVLVRDRANELIEKTVKEQLDEMSVQTEQQMDKSVKKVISEFDRLQAILLGEEDDGKPSIQDYINNANETLHTVYPKLMQYISSAMSLREGCQSQTFVGESSNCPGVVKYSIKFRLRADPDDPNTDIVGHAHFCAKHHRDAVNDPSMEVIDVFKMEDMQICPWKHPVKRAPMIFDDTTGTWVDGVIVPAFQKES